MMEISHIQIKTSGHRSTAGGTGTGDAIQRVGGKRGESFHGVLVVRMEQLIGRISVESTIYK